jgi:RsiW-degrading membrane proteinase PrsW (M82 family)
MTSWSRRLLAVLLSIPAIAWTAELLAGTPPLLLVAALLPAALTAAAILVAQRGAGRTSSALAFSVAWGAIGAAFLATSGNALARRGIDALSDGDDRTLTALLVAPLLEEAAKALGLVLILGIGRRELRSARDGIVYGALVGVGFVFTENLLYLGLAMLQGGEAGLLRGLYLRGILGQATHVVFTACAGAGLGWSAGREGHGTRRRWTTAALAFASALLLHVAWNALAAPAIARALCGAPAGTLPCLDAPTNAALFGQSTLVALAFLAPGLALLRAAWRASRHER